MYQKQIPAIALLLSEKNLGVIYFIFAILDFVYLANYTSHTNKRFGYIKHTVMRIDKRKKVF